MKTALSGLVIRSGYGLTSRQIRVRATNGTTDYAGDIVVPAGYSSRGNSVPVLLNHEATIQNMVGRATVLASNTEVDAVITFMPEGLSQEADDACAKYKAGIGTDVSIGFNPVQFEPINNGRGLKYTKWELFEISLVVVGCNPDAVVTGKRFAKAGRVLSGANATKLQQAHDLAENSRALIADVLDGAGGDTDEAKAKRRRDLDIVDVNTPPPMSRHERMAVARDIELRSLRNAP